MHVVCPSSPCVGSVAAWWYKGTVVMGMEADVDRLIGTRLDGRYDVVSLIGHGGMGCVYLAEETRLRRRCALKVLHPHLGADRSNVERFLREAQMIAQLVHPNIIDVHAYGEEPSGVVFFVMELLTGEDFDGRIAARGERPYTTHDVCLWGMQIARAVGVVHDAGLIHRDLKTSNLFLATLRDGEEVVKLLDFGIARREDGSELTRTGVSLGTPNYMSPEQVRGLPVDRRTDIYAYGVVLYKLLTGRVPFSGEAIQVAMQHCETPPPPPSKVAPAAGISPALEALVLRAMAKSPADRPQSMQEIEQALAALLADEAPEIAVPSTNRRMRTSPGNSMSTRKPTGPLPLAAAPATSDATSPSTARTGATIAMRTPNRIAWWLPLLTLTMVGSVAAVLVVGLSGDRDKAAPLPTVSATAPAPIAPTTPPIEATPPPEPVKPAAKPEPTPDPPPEPEPATPEPPTVDPTPSHASSASKAKPAIVDPIKEIKRRARTCRKQFPQETGSISIGYAIGVDGKVTRAVPSEPGELGKCLAETVKQTQFPAKFQLGQSINL